MKSNIRNTVWRCAIALVLASVPLMSFEAHAQEPTTVQVVQVDGSRLPEVDVYVSVTDDAGQPVINLTAEDFELEEDGQSVTPARVSRAGEQGPVTVVLIIDKSGSMEYAGKMEAAKEAAIAFVELMRRGDATGVIAFNTQVTTLQEPTDDQELLIEAIGSIEAVDDTALYDALHAASAILEPVSGRKAIIVVTDGMNTAGESTREDTLSMVDQQGISIYTIGLGDPTQGTGSFAGIDEPTLMAISEGSNGIYTFAPNPDELQDLYELLSLRIQNEYRLTYRSPNPLRDGSNRNVTVRVAAPSGLTEVTGTYNAGGVIPEVVSRSTWGLFTLILVVLAFLLFLPGIIGRFRPPAADRAAAPRPSKAVDPGPSAAKGRIRLTGQPPPSNKQKQ